jgi:hypothetical protein
MADSEADRILSEHNTGYDKASNMRSLWQSLLFYFLPADEHLVYSADSLKGEFDIPADSEGIKAAWRKAAGLYSFMVTRGDRVAALSVDDPELAKNDDVTEFLAKRINLVTKMIHTSNFPSVAFDVLRHYAVLGTDILYSYYDEEIGNMNYRYYRTWDCVLFENAAGRIDKLSREEKIPAYIAKERWGKDLPADVLQDADSPDNMMDTADYIVMVEPNPDYISTIQDPSKAALAKHFKYRQIWVHKSQKKIVESGKGYRTFPYHIARSGVQVNSLPYGRSAGMDALGTARILHNEIQQYNDLKELVIRGRVLSPKGAIDPLDYDPRPGAHNQYTPIDGMAPVVERPQGGEATLRAVIEDIGIQRQDIREFFQNDIFNALDQITGANPTATEVQEAAIQKIQGIAPEVGTLEPEFFATIVERNLDIIDLHQLGEQPPRILEGRNYSIKVTTRIDAQLQAADTRSTLVAIGQVAEVDTVFKENPELATIMDKTKIQRDILYTNNVDPEHVYSERETQQKQKELLKLRERDKITQDIVDKIGNIDPMKSPEPGSMIAQGGLSG